MTWTISLLTAAAVGLMFAARAHGWTLRESVGEVIARLFPRRPVPARRLPKRLLTCATATATVGVSGRTMLPGRIELRVHPDDLAPFRGALEWLRADVQSGVDERVAAGGWDTPTRVVVDVVKDDKRPVGRPTAAGVFTEWPDRVDVDVVRPKVPFTTTPAPGVETREALTDEPATAAAGPLVEMRVDDGSPVVVAVTGTGFVVGRGREAAIRVRDEAASRTHCRIRAGSDGLMVTDLGSTNGTTLNGNEVRVSTRLPSIGTLMVGNSRVRFRVVAGDEMALTGA